mmetsp:Transcript_4457/g.7967  ORF Transcript_4457/g.7967 Transcript_4457/m.7967 type:complete len:160 (+) Transcript_4457:1564-2043(+)
MAFRILTNRSPKLEPTAIYAISVFFDTPSPLLLSIASFASNDPSVAVVVVVVAPPRAMVEKILRVDERASSLWIPKRPRMIRSLASCGERSIDWVVVEDFVHVVKCQDWMEDDDASLSFVECSRDEGARMLMDRCNNDRCVVPVYVVAADNKGDDPVVR